MAFNIKSIGHAFAIAAHDLVQAAKFIAAVSEKVAGKAPAVEAAVNDVLATVAPQALPVARAAEFILGEALAAIHAAGPAASAGGVNVVLNAEVVADLLAIKDALSSHPAVQATIAAPNPTP